MLSLHKISWCIATCFVLYPKTLRIRALQYKSRLQQYTIKSLNKLNSNGSFA